MKMDVSQIKAKGGLPAREEGLYLRWQWAGSHRSRILQEIGEVEIDREKHTHRYFIASLSSPIQN